MIRMTIVLINPPYRYQRGITSGGLNPPLGLMYLSSYCKSKGYKTKLIDAVLLGQDNIGKIDNYYYRGLSFEKILNLIPNDTKLIGITNLFSSSYPVVKRLIAFLKQNRNVLIAIGGANPSAIPKYVLENTKADFVVLSEGEETLVELVESKDLSEIDGLAYRENDKIIINPKRKFIKNLDLIPFPDRESANPNDYSRYKEGHAGTKSTFAPVLTSRGCPYGCRFCTSNLWQRKFRARSAENVVDEIEWLVKNFGVKEIHFEDENLTLNKKRAIEIFKEIIRRKLDITWLPANGIRASVTDYKTLEYMKKSGCNYIIVAPESGSKRVLKEIINKQQDLNEVERCIKNAKSLGIRTGAYFIIGFPGETKKEINQTLKFVIKLAIIGCDEIVVGPFAPLPGSELFDELLAKGRLKLNEEFFDSMFTSGDLSSEDVSWNEHLSNDELRKTKIRIYLFFHVLRLIFHPFRSVKSAINVLTKNHELKTEKTLGIMLKRSLSRYAKNK